MWASVQHVEEIDHFQATNVGIMLSGTLIAVILMSVGVGKTVIKMTPPTPHELVIIYRNGSFKLWVS